MRQCTKKYVEKHVRVINSMYIHYIEMQLKFYNENNLHKTPTLAIRNLYSNRRTAIAEIVIYVYIIDILQYLPFT